ncbi:MAG: hypothetical protein PHS80_13980, partial [Methanothrix sp.]|nr:hypothetical protein [Methanothrix sp.]
LVITLILFFIAIILIALFLNPVKAKEQEISEGDSSKKTITNYIVSEPIYNYKCLKNSIYENCYKKEINEGGYSHFSEKEQQKDFLGSYITRYVVFVQNRENVGNYFTVIFNFKNQKGFEYSESITQYLRAGEKKEFSYKDIQFERTEILSWSYNIERV